MTGFPNISFKLDEQEFSFLTGLVFCGFTVAKAGLGWNVTLRAMDAGGVFLYCTGRGEDFEQVFKDLLSIQGSSRAADVWFRDKFASRQSVPRGGRLRALKNSGKV